MRQLRRPFHIIVVQPRGFDPGQFSRSTGIYIYHGIGMPLQETGHHLRPYVPFHRPTNDVRLMLTGGNKDDPACTKDGSDPHGYGFQRDIFFPEEIGSRIFSGHLIEPNRSGAVIRKRTGFIESDMPCTTNTENLNADAAGFLDLILVPATVLTNVFRWKITSRYKNLLLGYIQVIE